MLYVCWPELYAFQRNIVKAEEMGVTGIFANACTFPPPGGRNPTTSTALLSRQYYVVPKQKDYGIPKQKVSLRYSESTSPARNCWHARADRVFCSIQDAGRTFRPGRIVRRHNMLCRCPPTVEESVTCPSRTLDKHAPLRHYQPHSLPRRRRPPTGRPRPSNRPLGPTRHRPHPAP